jgi:D-beta-D-heptose 7-phosphate kinase/D-beta-D-heptose 1-phosphate adenosyltransferase
MNIQEYFDSELQEHSDVLNETRKGLFGPFHKLVNDCTAALTRGNKIIIFGNGGSAADAQHIATEFVVRFRKNRKAFPAIALTTDTSALTAIGNDYGFDHLFSRQVEALCAKDDLVIGISTSGNSENVIRALDAAKKIGATTVALGGGDGGKMTAIADYAIIVPTRVTARIQEMHITIGHMLCGAVENDRFVYGQVSRISPEAPVPVLTYNETKATLGGAGNVVRNLTALGANVFFVSVVGDDDESQEIGVLLKESAECATKLLTEKKRKTIVKTRFVADRQQILRVDSESTHPIEQETRVKLMQSLEEFIGTCDVVVLSDYGKGLLCKDIPSQIIGMSRKAGKKVLVDPKGKDYHRYAGAHVITPTLKELKEATEMSVSGDHEVIAAAKKIIERYGIDAVLTTRSQEGMTLVQTDGGVTHLRAEAKEVFDVSGAGDTVIAVTASAISVGAPFGFAAELANVAAGIVVGKFGTAVVHKQELTQALFRQEMTSAEAKVMDLSTAQDIVELWRRKGYKVGFTNGVFDLLHPGHISLLSQAAKACGRLIVGLNSDFSVRRIKGEDPVQHETARSAILASLEAVDAVVIFQEDTPVTLIETLRPDVLIKGTNYRPDEVVGSDIVKGYGGSVCLVDIKDAHDVNATIAAITKGTL